MKTSLSSLLLANLDRELPSLVAAQKAAGEPAGGWLRAVRQSLGLSQAVVAKRIGITQQAYARFERGEVNGTLSLGNLHRAAVAMDCDLVHFFVPRTGRAGSFGELARLFDPDLGQLRASEHSMALEGQAVGDLPPKSSGKQ